MNRRELIKAFAASASLTVAGRVWAAPSTDARLLVVFLRGAYDAANVVVPTGSDFYYASRPTLAIARPDVGNPNAALALNSDWGLHPALRDSLYPLWAKLDEAAFRLGVRMALAELALSGCTTTSDHHYLFPRGLERALDIEVEEAARVGLRVVLTRGSMSLSDQDGGLPPR